MFSKWCLSGLLVVCICCIVRPSYGQYAGNLEQRIDSLKAHQARLMTEREQIGEEINKIEEELAELEYARAMERYGESGYPAVITTDRCDVSLSGKEGIPGKGDKILVVGATHDGYWKFVFGESEGTAGDRCVKFTDRSLDEEALRDGLIREAEARYAAEQLRLDALAEAEKAREDSIKTAELERLAAQVAEIQKGYDAIGRTNYPLRVHDVWMAEMNSVGGVTVGLNAQYFKKSKAIKYLYFTLIPYNSVGDKVACTIRGTSDFIGRVTGPVDAQYEPYYWFWETAWYNSAITCIKLTRVKIEYMDGTSITYAREVHKILGEFSNLCSR